MRYGLHLALLLALSAPAPALSQGRDVPLQDTGVTVTQGTETYDLRALSGMFPNGAPNLLAPDSFATQYRLPLGVQRDLNQKVPTKLDYADGPMRWDVETNFATQTAPTTVIPGTPDQAGAGGSGNMRGRVTYSAEQWEFYSSRNVGMNQANGAQATMQESTTIGSLYKLPDWANGAKIGTSLELLPTNERKSRVEYRQSFGPAEGFVAAEQILAPHQNDLKTAPTTFRGGVSRKF